MAAVARPRERLARVSFTGPGLADLPDEEPGDVLTLIWPDGHARNFTIRAYDRARATVEVDFILHGDAGTASAWACRARVGQKLWFYGPRVHFVEDPEADWTLLAGDETAAAVDRRDPGAGTGGAADPRLRRGRPGGGAARGCVALSPGGHADLARAPGSGARRPRAGAGGPRGAAAPGARQAASPRGTRSSLGPVAVFRSS